MAKTRFPSKIIPPVYQTVFERQRIFDIFAENLHKPLIWVQGSPGAGKTTLVSSWLKQQQAQFLWYRMNSGINLCADLFYFLALSAQRNYPQKKLNLPIFTVEYADNIKAFAAVFFRQLFAILEGESAIVFDNCQEIENDPDFFHVLQVAVNEIPEGLQVFCISRNRPAHFFSRVSVVGDLLDITPALLRFTETESAAFINWLNPDIDAETCAILQMKAKGWAVALVLLSQRKSCGLEVPVSDEHDQQDVFSFLITEVLANIDKTSLLFLTKTAIFNQFSVDMAIALTDNPNAQNLLEELVNNNFLIDRTDETQPVFSYHPILRNLLNRQNKRLLTVEQLNALNYRAIKVLIEQKKIEDAMPLYLQLQDWSGTKSLLLKHAEYFINNGRHHTVIIWIEQIPTEILDNEPWLLYWYAVAIKPLSPSRSVKLLDQCYQDFFTTRDKLGLYSSWQVAVEAIILSQDDFTPLKTWFQRFDELHKYYPNCPSFELKIKYSATALQALAFYNPQHPWYNKLLKLSEYGFRLVPVKLLQQLICSQLGTHYSWSCEIAKLQVLNPYLLKTIDDDNALTILRLSSIYSVMTLNLYQGNGDTALNYLENGLEISEQSAIPMFKSLFKLFFINCHICQGDLASAQNCLDNFPDDVSSKHRLLNALSHLNAAWISAIKGQIPLALEQNEHSLMISRHIKNHSGIVCSLGLKTRLLAESAQWELAEQALLSLAKLNQELPIKFRQHEYHLSDAWLGILSNNQDRALAGTKQLFSLLSHEQVRFFIGWQPKMMSSLCTLAIEHGIEVEFAVSMMQVNALCPPPPQHLEQWPWPVRIYCFKDLKIELNGQRLVQEGKSQKKIFELLLTIIALGSRNIQGERLCDCLWPESDGDLAQQTLKAAIFRLRKLIGKSAVLVEGGKISFNPAVCWIDVLAFENSLKEMDDIFEHQPDKTLLVNHLCKQLLHLYQGSFPHHADSSVILFKQKQLQKKFARMIENLIIYYEKQHQHNKISRVLEQSLNRISQFESEYQELSTYLQKKSKSI